MKGLVLIAFLVFVSSCSENNTRPESEVVAEFQVEVELVNDCPGDIDSECELVVVGCDLALCGVAVNKERKSEFEVVSDDLVSQFDGGSERCDRRIKCASSIAKCVESKCEAVLGDSQL